MRPHRQQPTRLRRPWDSPRKNTGVGCHFLLHCVEVKGESEVAQSRPTRGDPMDCSPPGSSILGFSRQEYWSGLPLPSPEERSLVFLILLFSSISLHCSLRKVFSSLLAILWNSAFRWVYLSFSPLPYAFLFSAICKTSSTTILPFCTFFPWGWFWSPPPVQCYKPLSIELQGLCLSDPIPWIYLSLWDLI